MQKQEIDPNQLDELPLLIKSCSQEHTHPHPFKLKRNLSVIESLSKTIEKQLIFEKNKDWHIILNNQQIILNKIDALQNLNQMKNYPAEKNEKAEIEENFVGFAENNEKKDLLHEENLLNVFEIKKKELPDQNIAKDEEINLFDFFYKHEIEAEFAELLKEAPFYNKKNLNNFWIRCKICTEKKKKIKRFDCSHIYCKPCVKLLLQSFIESSKVSPNEISCPECEKPISEKKIKSVLDRKTYEKILKIRENLKIQQLVMDQKAVYCPIPDCKGYGHIISAEPITVCVLCRISLCRLCKQVAHPGATCEEFALESLDPDIENYFHSQKLRKCPSCGVPVEKISGCQFVTCNSSLCKGKTALCYVCGMKITESQHYSHFKVNGPYGQTCNTVDGVSELQN